MTARKPPKSANSGSPTTGEPEYLVVGKLRRSHGLHGEMLMDVVTDFPERLEPGVKVFIGPEHRPSIILDCRKQAHGMLIRFRDIDSPETAAVYRNQSVFVLAADRPSLPEGMYYHHELLGLPVIDESDRQLGELVEIIQTGANDVFVVKSASGRELLLPAIEGVVLELNPLHQLIRVRIPQGLESPARPQGEHDSLREAPHSQDDGR